MILNLYNLCKNLCQTFTVMGFPGSSLPGRPQTVSCGERLGSLGVRMKVAGLTVLSHAATCTGPGAASVACAAALLPPPGTSLYVSGTRKSPAPAAARLYFLLLFGATRPYVADLSTQWEFLWG